MPPAWTGTGCRSPGQQSVATAATAPGCPGRSPAGADSDGWSRKVGVTPLWAAAAATPRGAPHSLRQCGAGHLSLPSATAGETSCRRGGGGTRGSLCFAVRCRGGDSTCWRHVRPTAVFAGRRASCSAASSSGRRAAWRVYCCGPDAGPASHAERSDGADPSQSLSPAGTDRTPADTTHSRPKPG